MFGSNHHFFFIAQEHGSGLLEDIVIPLKSSESLILEADANQSDNEIEEIMSDLAFDDMTIIKREEIPDQDQNLVMGLDQDFIISEESEVKCCISPFLHKFKLTFVHIIINSYLLLLGGSLSYRSNSYQ